MTSRHSSLPYYQQVQQNKSSSSSYNSNYSPSPQPPIITTTNTSGSTSTITTSTSTTTSFPPPQAIKEHTPLSIHENTSRTTARSTDMFRQRHSKKPFDEDYDDIDLSLDYDSKIFKARHDRVLQEKMARKKDWRITIALTLWACYIRLWKIAQPSSVV